MSNIPPNTVLAIGRTLERIFEYAAPKLDDSPLECPICDNYLHILERCLMCTKCGIIGIDMDETMLPEHVED